jgi:hypothetical protein
MGFGNSMADSVAALLLHGTPIADLADNDATTPLTSLYLALHTADPEAGDQTTNEATYTSYARLQVDRDSDQWTLAGDGTGGFENAVENAFPQATGGSNDITHFSIGTLSSGAGVILFAGALSATLAVSNGIAPRFQAGELTGVIA